MSLEARRAACACSPLRHAWRERSWRPRTLAQIGERARAAGRCPRASWRVPSSKAPAALAVSAIAGTCVCRNVDRGEWPRRRRRDKRQTRSRSTRREERVDIGPLPSDAGSRDISGATRRARRRPASVDSSARTSPPASADQNERFSRGARSARRTTRRAGRETDIRRDEGSLSDRRTARRGGRPTRRQSPGRRPLPLIERPRSALHHGQR